MQVLVVQRENKADLVGTTFVAAQKFQRQNEQELSL